MSNAAVIDALITRRLRCIDAMRRNVRDDTAFNEASRLEAALAARISQLRGVLRDAPMLSVHPYHETEN